MTKEAEIQIKQRREDFLAGCRYCSTLEDLTRESYLKVIHDAADARYPLPHSARVVTGSLGISYRFVDGILQFKRPDELWWQQWTEQESADDFRMLADLLEKPYE